MKTRHWYTPWLLLGPAVIWVLVFGIWPFLSTIGLSFTDARALQQGNWVGAENYVAIVEDERFWYALGTTLIYVVVCVPLLTVLPLLVALLVEKKVPGIAFFRTSAYFPVVASVVVVALIWDWMFDTKGLVNGFLQHTGVINDPIAFLIDRWWVLFVSISLTVWKGLGYYMVVFLAALGNVAPELHEAAAIDGASPFKRLIHVTIPGVRGAMMLVMSLIAVSAMRVFSELYILTNGTGGPGGYDMSLVMLVKQVGSGISGRVGYASAISVVLFFLTLGPLLLTAWMNREKRA